MMKNLMLLLLLATLVSCNRAYDAITPIEKAYLYNDISYLIDFLDDESKKSVPISDEELSSIFEFIQHSYSIFEDFYNPFNLGRIGENEYGDSVYFGVKYVVVQNEINVEIVKDDDFEEFFDVENFSAHYFKLSLEKRKELDNLKVIAKLSVRNFRPRLNFNEKKIIYDNSFISNQIEYFLSKQKEEGNRKEYEKRKAYLNEMIHVYGCHWSSCVHHRTDPSVSLTFNESLNKAVVNFGIFYQGGSAIYYLIDGEWVFQRSKIEWIT